MKLKEGDKVGFYFRGALLTELEVEEFLIQSEYAGDAEEWYATFVGSKVEVWIEEVRKLDAPADVACKWAVILNTQGKVKAA